MNGLKCQIYLLFLIVITAFPNNSYADVSGNLISNNVVGDSGIISKASISNNILYICSYNTDSRSTAETLEPFVKRCNEIDPSRQVLVESMESTGIKELFSYKGRIKAILNKYMVNGHSPALVVLIGREAVSTFLSLDEPEYKRIPIAIGSCSANIVSLPHDSVDIRKYPFALYVDDPVMRRFAKYIAVEKGFLEDAASLYDQSGNYPTLGRELVFLSHLDEFLEEKAEEPHPADTWLHSLQIMTARRGQMFMGMKGGHNDESHNHNDVGSFVVYHNGKPILVDPGVGEYTSKTFSKERYTIWTMQSAYHNLPQVNGFDQHEGRKYAARDVKYSKGMLSLDLRDCYPSDAGIKKWNRTVAINKKGVVTLTDDYLLEKVVSPVREMFVSAVCPVLDEQKGVISLGSCSLSYPKSKCDVDIQPLSDRLDPMLRSMWPEGLWRIVITSKNMSTNDILSFIITPRL